MTRYYKMSFIRTTQNIASRI